MIHPQSPLKKQREMTDPTCQAVESKFTPLYPKTLQCEQQAECFCVGAALSQHPQSKKQKGNAKQYREP